ncbi:MAG: rhomboid family intramembrane serine protease [Bacteroidales bacterium]|jgi:membrane associated rhomboid family serine protease|nr:rhomboid family intramembrane serine protease [Bacteroidales bacterium]
MFLAQFVAEKSFGIRLEDLLGLRYPGASEFRPWQLISYMFLHGNFWHLFFNMFALWMFGNALENIWGPKRFLIYYFITGIGAALIHYLVFYFFDLSPVLNDINSIMTAPTYQAVSDFISRDPNLFQLYIKEFYSDPQKFFGAMEILKTSPDNKQAVYIVKNLLVDYREFYMNLPNVIGASGAVFGILLAFGMLFPNTLIYIYFFFPLKAKYFVIAYGLIELFYGFTGSGSNVAHFAHLGGMIFGFFLILYWKKKGRLY